MMKVQLISLNILTSTLLLPNYGAAFVPGSISSTTSHSINTNRKSWGLLFEPSAITHTTRNQESSSTLLCAQKKKRRRRKTNTPSTTQESNIDPSSTADEDEDELPDFEIVETIDLIEKQQKQQQQNVMASTSTAGVAPVAGTVVDINDPNVIAAMRATKGSESIRGAGSTKDLLRSRNRELENKLVINEVSEELPSLAEYTQGKSSNNSGAGIGKKAARRQARVAAAVEAEGSPEEESFLDKLPFFKKDEEKEEKTLIKLLEEGTWACIYALGAWEVYINTPLFNRAGPMAPVVFTDPVTMTFLL